MDFRDKLSEARLFLWRLKEVAFEFPGHVCGYHDGYLVFSCFEVEGGGFRPNFDTSLPGSLIQGKILVPHSEMELFGVYGDEYALCCLESCPTWLLMGAIKFLEEGKGYHEN